MQVLIDRIRATLKRSSANDPATSQALYRQNLQEPLSADRNVVRRGRKRTPLTPERLIEIAETSGEPMAVHPVQLHAFHLLLVLRADYAGKEVRASDVERIYLEICQENWWLPLRWKHKNGVAHHFRLLNSHGKTYRWFVTADGVRHRLSIYHISQPAPAPERAKRRRNMTPDVAPLPRRPEPPERARSLLRQSVRA